MNEQHEEVLPHKTNLVIPIGSTLAEIERQAVFWALEQTGGNRTHAARILGISIRTLRNKIVQYRAESVRAG